MTSIEIFARNLANRLIQEHQKKRPWREIAQEDYPPIVKAGTLNRIAKSGGKWMPKNKKILAALGMCKQPPKYDRPAWLYKWYRLPVSERHDVMKKHIDEKG